MKTAGKIVAAILGLGACAKGERQTMRPPIKPPAAAWYLSTGPDSLFVEQHPLELTEPGEGIFVDIAVDTARRFQEIDGFGASFTDSAAYLINQKLSPAAREELLVKLFHPEDGIGLSVTRQPMGSSDFARYIYSFDEVPAGEEDFELARFSIEHDKEDIIPLLKRARELNPELLIMASPWSPPAWMKTSGSMIGGSLRRDCYPAFADYFVKYIEAYRAEGLPVYAVTPQNEPRYVPDHYPGSGMDAPAQAAFIRQNLGPAFRERGIDTKILCYDHNWDVKNFAETVLGSGAGEYVAGVAWHWYGGDASAQSEVLKKFPAAEVHFTEGSGGEWVPPFTDAFMNCMVQGIKILNNHSRTYVLWNMALDENNGPVVPGFGRSTCRGIVKIDQQTGELVYNLDYYALAHFSRYIRPGAVRVYAESKGRVYAAAAQNRDGSLVIVAANDDRGPKTLRFTVGAGADASAGSFTATLPGKSAATWVLVG